jgi:serine/threonine protein kinase
LLNNEYYALKEVPKYMLYPESKIYSHLTEPNILKRFTQYNFLPKIISSFQDYDNIYLITNYLDGKSLSSFIYQNMTEEQIKFFSACTIQSLIYLRQEKIIHRDITMYNIIMDKNKYFNLIDFSFAIDYSQKDNKEKYFNTFRRVTPPEMLNFKKFDYNSDYYRLGSIIYYSIFKTYPNIVKLKKIIK